MPTADALCCCTLGVDESGGEGGALGQGLSGVLGEGRGGGSGEPVPPVRDALGVGEGGVGGTALPVALGLLAAEGEALGLAPSESVAVGVPVPVGVGVPVAVAVGVLVGVTLGEDEGVALPDRDVLPVLEGEAPDVKLAVGEADCVVLLDSVEAWLLQCQCWCQWASPSQWALA